MGATINRENIVKGNNTLAEILGVSTRSVQMWRKEGILDPAILADFRRTVVYDLAKVMECLRHRQPKYRLKK